jgi:hypothetical protein
MSLLVKKFRLQNKNILKIQTDNPQPTTEQSDQPTTNEKNIKCKTAKCKMKKYFPTPNTQHPTPNTQHPI